MKVVIDTNILVNASYDESSCAFRIVREVIEGRIEAFATHQTMGENRQMLRKLVRDREYRELLEEFFRRLQIVKIYEPVEVVADPEDNKLFWSAVSSGADYLISKDQEVLDVGEYPSSRTKGSLSGRHVTKVITPEDFWAKYQSEEDDNSAWGNWARMIMGK